ncbi:MAG: DUF3592 domain-containing protein [Marinomonas sp.]
MKLWVGGIFFTLGIVFSCTGAAFYYNDRQLEAKVGQASGIVIALNRHRDTEGTIMYRPEVEFRDQQGTLHRFTSDVSSSSPGVALGGPVDVIYDPDAPGDAGIDSFMYRYFLLLIFAGMGGLFALIGGAMLLSHLRRKRTIEHLYARGMRIEMPFTRCYVNTSLRINGRSPYVVEAQGTHPITGKFACFQSEPIWLNLSSALDGQKVPVLIDPNSPKDHVIDLRQWVDVSARA